MTATMEVDGIPMPNGQTARRWMADRGGRKFSVLLTRDELQPGDERWHLSIAGVDGKVPDWDDIAALAHRLRPGVTFAIGVPPKSWWLNIHPGCLHLWELRDRALEDQWRAERRGDTPS